MKGTLKEVRQFIWNREDIVLEFSKGSKVDVNMSGMFLFS